MHLEQQVCSLDLAKQLAKLGVRQDSLFWWHENNDLTRLPYLNERPSHNAYRAYTASELTNILPVMFNGSPLQILHGLIFGDITPVYSVRYYDAGLIGDSDFNMANALAKMLIYLLENKLIELPTCQG